MSTLQRWATGSLLSTIICLLCAGPAFGIKKDIDIDNPPKGMFVDEWYAIMMKGKKAGHAHIIVERVPGKGRELIRTTNTTKISMQRMGQQIDANVTEQSLETLDGKPTAFAMVMQTSGMAMKTNGKIRNNKVEVTTQVGQAGSKTSETHDLPEGAMMSWGQFRAEADRELKVGLKYEVNSYVPHMAPDRLIPIESEVLGRETIDLFGRNVEVFRIRETMKIPGMLGQANAVSMVNYVDDEGDILRSDMDMMGFPIQLVACTKTVAMAKNHPAELMQEALVRIPDPIKLNAESVRYRLSFKVDNDQMTLPKLPATDTQEIVTQSVNKAEIIVRQPKPFGQGDKAAKLSENDSKRYLAASGILNHADPVIVKLAKKAADGETDHWKLADKLRRFVSDYVSDKNLNVGFATASEVARSKQGDCSEHSVLLAALGRANNIPTRLVTGLIFVRNFEGHRNVFGGHMWTQFYIDGRWVDLDAAQNQTEIEPTHIAISLTDGGSSGFADMTNALWFNLNNLKIEVVEQK